MNQDTLVLAAGAAVTVERITEYILNILFMLLADFATAWEEKLSGGIKLLLTFVVNAGLYALFFRIDFISPVVESLGATINPVSGTAMSCIIVGGGSQLVHQFFGFFKKPG